MEALNFSLCSYNCCSLNKNIDLVRMLTSKEYDFIFLQETLVTENRLGELSFIDEYYNVVGSSSVYSDKAFESNAGRSEGGLACLWRKDATYKLEKIIIENDYIIMSVGIGSLSIVLVNVYVRSDIWETRTLNDYLETLSQFDNIVSSMKFDSIYFIGDFNANPKSGRAWNNLSSFMDRNDFKCFDVDMLEESTFTFISYGDAHTGWLDHVVGRNSNATHVNNFEVLYDMVGSDHLPLVFNVNVASSFLHQERPPDRKSNAVCPTFIKWQNLNSNEVQYIDGVVVDALIKYKNCGAMSCVKAGCRRKEHLEQLRHFYLTLCDSIILGRSKFVKRMTKRNKYKVIPGWNRNVKHLYVNARERYFDWLKNGRLRDCLEFERMKESRKMFKEALNNCKLNEVRESSISIQEKYLDKDMKSFWKGVQQKNNKIKYSEVIDGKNNSMDVINIFNQKFLITESVGNLEMEMNVIECLRNSWVTERKFHPSVSPDRIKLLVKQLNMGEGHDGIHTIFLREMSEDLSLLVSFFMNASYNHCFIPEELLTGDINPTIKDPKGNATESANYRPVMQSSCLLKLFEIHLLEILSEKLVFNSRQFGFRKNTSTTDACLILKETIYNYIASKKERVYGLFVDLSKAFDNVDHFQLGQILLQSKIPPDIVLFILHYLRNQEARIVWNGEMGEYIPVEKGVRQGGILSPLLFKLYIDDVLNEISAGGDGCKFGVLQMNILAYADDLVLLARSRSQLGRLYKILEKGMNERKLLINKNKSKCIVFDKCSGNIMEDNIEICDTMFEVVKKYKYLGHIIQNNLLDLEDVEYRLNAFYGKFNWLFRNFKNVSIDVFYFLFKSFCVPDYGLPLWNLGEIVKRQIFKTFEVAFSKSLKRMLGVPLSTSSHAVADIFNQLLFIHYVTVVQTRYFKRVFCSNTPLIRISSFTLGNGYLYKSLFKRLNDNYDVNFSMHSLDILKARVEWVQRHEPMTGQIL